MGGPVATIYVPEQLGNGDAQAIEQMMNDRTWRACAANEHVLHVSIEHISHDHDPDEIDALQAALGWRPLQQILVASFAGSQIEFHIDVATAAARLARKFNGLICVLTDPKRYELMQSSSTLIIHPHVQHLTGSGAERIVGPEWLDEFLTHDEPRFWK